MFLIGVPDQCSLFLAVVFASKKQEFLQIRDIFFIKYSLYLAPGK